MENKKQRVLIIHLNEYGREHVKIEGIIISETESHLKVKVNIFKSMWVYKNKEEITQKTYGGGYFALPIKE